MNEKCETNMESNPKKGSTAYVLCTVGTCPPWAYAINKNGIDCKIRQILYSCFILLLMLVVRTGNVYNINNILTIYIKMMELWLHTACNRLVSSTRNEHVLSLTISAFAFKKKLLSFIFQYNIICLSSIHFLFFGTD